MPKRGTVLPSLSPDETFALATKYLRAADGRTDEGAVAIVHVAAGLYGTALATSSELRLLAHVNLLKRKTMKEFVVAGLLISPFVKFALIAGVLFLPIRLDPGPPPFRQVVLASGPRGRRDLYLPPCRPQPVPVSRCSTERAAFSASS